MGRDGASARLNIDIRGQALAAVKIDIIYRFIRVIRIYLEPGTGAESRAGRGKGEIKGSGQVAGCNAGGAGDGEVPGIGAGQSIF